MTFNYRGMTLWPCTLVPGGLSAFHRFAATLNAGSKLSAIEEATHETCPFVNLSALCGWGFFCFSMHERIVLLPRSARSRIRRIPGGHMPQPRSHGTPKPTVAASIVIVMLAMVAIQPFASMIVPRAISLFSSSRTETTQGRESRMIS